jgi:hypothetical protein
MEEAGTRRTHLSRDDRRSARVAARGEVGAEGETKWESVKEGDGKR